MEKLTRDGVSLYFEDAGKGTPPFLLIHDLGQDHITLQPQFEHFRGRHRVVAVDLPGHGQSDVPHKAYTLDCFAEDLAWLCRESGVYRPVAMGLGFGGMIAVELAGRCPDLPAAVVVVGAPIMLIEAGAWSRTAVGRLDGAAQRETIASNPYLAQAWEDALTWDGARALTSCRVPLLYIKDETTRADIDSIRGLCPRVVFKSVQFGDLGRVQTVNQINAAVDAFLNMESKE